MSRHPPFCGIYVHRVLVHGLHDVVCVPSSGLLDLFVRESLLVHVRGEEVPELVDAEAGDAELFRQNVQMFR